MSLKRQPHIPYPYIFWHWWDVHQTLDADITGHVQKSPRVGKGDSRQFSFTSSCTIVSCDLQLQKVSLGDLAPSAIAYGWSGLWYSGQGQCVEVAGAGQGCLLGSPTGEGLRQLQAEPA